MQKAKDTFYEEMRTRLESVNPARTMVVRGAVRPAVMVEENELAAGAVIADCFRLRWVEVAVDAEGALPQVTMRCDVAYETAGSRELNGCDRGRVLAAMDAELIAMVQATPQRATKKDFTGPAVQTMSTEVWWGDVVLGAVKVVGERLERVATVNVMAFEEAGDR